MGEYQKAPKCTCPVCGETAKMTADHIGPISLGFCHSTNIVPMCKACNSAKNNRLSLSDVRKLLTLEADGNQVVSWHSQYIWDKYKNTITSDKDARKLSSLMLKCHQNVLKLFSLFTKRRERISPDLSASRILHVRLPFFGFQSAGTRQTEDTQKPYRK